MISRGTMLAYRASVLSRRHARPRRSARSMRERLTAGWWPAAMRSSSMPLTKLS